MIEQQGSGAGYGKGSGKGGGCGAGSSSEQQAGSGFEHGGKLPGRSPVLYHRSGQWLGLALIVNRYKQLGSTCGLLLYTGLVNYLTQTIKNLRGSL